MISFLQDVSIPYALLADVAALAAVSCMGYLFGKRAQDRPVQVRVPSEQANLKAELGRAQGIAGELHEVTQRIRQELTAHQSKVSDFQSRVKTLDSSDEKAGWQDLSKEAESLIGPTLRMTTNLSLAYDQLRKQSSQLMTFAGSRTDAETGVHNRRALEEQLEVLFAMQNDTEGHFSLALFSLESTGDEPDRVAIAQFANLLEHSVRESDFVARYCTDEFAVVMPQTSLAGATIFSRRLLNTASEQFTTLAWGGVVETNITDEADKLLSRADSALYSARATTETCLFQHTCGVLKRVPGIEPLATAPEAAVSVDEFPALTPAQL